MNLNMYQNTFKVGVIYLNASLVNYIVFNVELMVRLQRYNVSSCS